MPYIKQSARSRAAQWPDSAGELNFAFTRLITRYFRRKGLSYQVINDIIGALEGAKLEIYRRRAVGYEDLKKARNGDVYVQDLLGSPVG